MLEYLKFASFTKENNGKKWEHKLYEPNKLADSFNLMTYFIASDEVNIEELQNYRETKETEVLIALNTTDKRYDCLKIADNIIHCGSDEIELAIYGLSFMNAYGNFIGIEWYDVKTALSYGKNIQFLQSSRIGENCVGVACEQLTEKFKACDSKYTLKGMMINIFADSSFAFEKLEFINNQVQENIDVDEVDIFYQVNFFEEFDSWKQGEQGCCICMLLIYADKENDIQPVTIEQNIPKKTPDTTQIAGNSIREYLKRQQQRNKNG